MSFFCRFTKLLGLMLALAALSVWLGACAGLPPSPVQVGVLPSPPQVMQHLEDRRRFVRSFVMQGEISLESEQGEISGEHLIQGAFPNRLRAEVRGPFDRPVLLLISDGVWLAVVDYQAGKGYLGRASRRNIARFVGLYLSVEEIYTLLSGSVPLIHQAVSLKVRHAEAGRARLDLMAAGGVLGQTVFFDPAGYQVLAARLREWGGGLTLEAAFGRFSRAGPFSYPRQVELNDQHGRKLVLTSDRLEINPGFEGDPFAPRLPKDLPVELLP